MRIGILSMQRVVNNGSFLQAYALYEILRHFGKGKVEFIDFENSLIKKKTELKSRNKLLRFLRRVKHTILPKYWLYMKTERYAEQFHETWESGLPLLGLSAEMQMSAEKQYDLVVIGSDEVFNICQFSDEGVRIPWELLGESIHTKRLISYAAACGQTTLTGIEKIGETEHCAGLLKQFDALSVRDENTFSVVRKLSGVTPDYHIDPVLLLPEFPEDASYQRPKFRYLLVYAYTRRISNQDEINAIQAYAHSRGLRTLCVNCFQTWCDEFAVTSPFGLLQYVRDSECVVTDTFHGTVFSIRCNVPFVTIVRDSNSNKLKFLLKQFELEEREVQSMRELGSRLAAPLNFAPVNEKLNVERKKAMEYLREQIRITEDEHND